jgi:CcmD family protein
MRMLRTLVCVALLMLGANLTVRAMQQPTTPQPPPAQGEFVPLSEVPPSEQIPSFTLVAAAYAFVWVVLLAYVWSISRRLQKVEQELSTLDRRSA